MNKDTHGKGIYYKGEGKPTHTGSLSMGKRTNKEMVNLPRDLLPLHTRPVSKFKSFENMSLGNSYNSKWENQDTKSHFQ